MWVKALTFAIMAKITKVIIPKTNITGIATSTKSNKTAFTIGFEVRNRAALLRKEKLIAFFMRAKLKQIINSFRRFVAIIDEQLHDLFYRQYKINKALKALTLPLAMKTLLLLILALGLTCFVSCSNNKPAEPQNDRLISKPDSTAATV